MGKTNMPRLVAVEVYVGPDHKVIAMKAFFSALVQVLWEADKRMD
jgi:hypothetical protein